MSIAFTKDKILPKRYKSAWFLRIYVVVRDDFFRHDEITDDLQEGKMRCCRCCFLWTNASHPSPLFAMQSENWVVYSRSSSSSSARKEERRKKKDIKRTGEIPLTKETQPTLRALSVPWCKNTDNGNRKCWCWVKKLFIKMSKSSRYIIRIRSSRYLTFDPGIICDNVHHRPRWKRCCTKTAQRVINPV